MLVLKCKHYVVCLTVRRCQCNGLYNVDLLTLISLCFGHSASLICNLVRYSCFHCDGCTSAWTCFSPSSDWCSLVCRWSFDVCFRCYSCRRPVAERGDCGAAVLALGAQRTLLLSWYHPLPLIRAAPSRDPPGLYWAAWFAPLVFNRYQFILD